MTLQLEQIAELRLEHPEEPAGAAQFATASGLVAWPERIYVVADDRPAVGVFHSSGGGGRLIALAGSDLPDDYGERKAAKPDLESLAALPASDASRHGALLTLGSGSTERRERGWLLALDDTGEPAEEAVEVSLTGLYERLRAELPDLNIEGAAVHGDALWLAQRGNGADGFNALVELDLAAALVALASDAELPAAALRGFSRWSLGAVEGVRLTFSDLSPSGRGLLFCAVAEAGESTYLDGECLGSGIGELDPRSGEVAWFRRLSEPHKVEGVSPGTGQVLLVADPDAAHSPAPLFRVASENLPT